MMMSHACPQCITKWTRRITPSIPGSRWHVKSISVFIIIGHCGKITAYLDRVHPYLYCQKLVKIPAVLRKLCPCAPWPMCLFTPVPHLDLCIIMPICPITNVPHHTCTPLPMCPSPMGHIGIIVHGSRWCTEVMGHMDDGAHGHNNVNSSIETNITHSWRKKYFLCCSSVWTSL